MNAQVNEVSVDETPTTRTRSVRSPRTAPPGWTKKKDMAYALDLLGEEHDTIEDYRGVAFARIELAQEASRQLLAKAHRSLGEAEEAAYDTLWDYLSIEAQLHCILTLVGDSKLGCEGKERLESHVGALLAAQRNCEIVLQRLFTTPASVWVADIINAYDDLAGAEFVLRESFACELHWNRFEGCNKND